MSDVLAVQLYQHMVKDFRQVLGDTEFGEGALKALRQSPGDFRDYVFPTLGQVPPLRFKAWWQLSNFLKRYRFSADKYSDTELEDRTYRSFFLFQETLYKRPEVGIRSFTVLQQARKIAKRILSLPYDTEPYRKFGRRATRSCPLSQAFFDKKLGDTTCFTSPPALRKEMLIFLESNPLGKQVRRVARKEKRRVYTEQDTLALTLVPKSWKTFRAITPLSEFGLYWSYGIGGYVEECLRLNGLNIRRLQDRHKMLAQKFSVTRSHTTADLSSASDSLTSDLLNRVLPRQLFTDLKKTFIHTLLVKGHRYYSGSCLPMGNAATFPVETLVFYCLIKAIGDLLGVKGIYSVYGDDLIYPTKIHPYVRDIFTDLGIKINGDKTFVKSHFRESCGGDYYHGIDVRPALFPEEDGHGLYGKRKLQYLYKVWNSLHDRWKRCELPSTFHFLEREITVASFGRLFFVPRSFPSTAGFRVSAPPRKSWLFEHNVHRTFSNGSCWYRFKCILDCHSPRRKIKHEIFYMFCSLSTSRDVEQFRGTLRWSSLRFLKSVRDPSSLILSRDGKEVSLCEPIHSIGPARVSQVQLSTWT